MSDYVQFVRVLSIVLLVEIYTYINTHTSKKINNKIKILCYFEVKLDESENISLSSKS